MIALARTTVMMTTLVCAMGLAGCRHLDREIEYHFGPIQQQQAEPAPATTRAVQPRRPRAKVAARTIGHTIAKPRVLSPGKRIRQFCGHRHIQFQRGTLHETAAEAGRNNVLCSQSG